MPDAPATVTVPAMQAPPMMLDPAAQMDIGNAVSDCHKLAIMLAQLQRNVQDLGRQIGALATVLTNLNAQIMRVNTPLPPGATAPQPPAQE
jgi:hypothetical protein